MEKLKNATLLYAEDEPTVQLQYQQYFAKIFKQVLVANDGEEALSLYNKHQPDALILDIKMPKLTGLEVTREIRQHNSALPIILLTAHSNKEILLDAIELRLTTFLEKPATRSKLQRALEQLSQQLDTIKPQALWAALDTSYSWDHSSLSLYRENTEIHLTRNEKLLFDLLLKHIGKMVNYFAIHTAVWGHIPDSELKPDSIKTLIKELRKKLPPKAISNIRNSGYRLEESLSS